MGSWESRRKQIVRASSTCREELDHKGVSGAGIRREAGMNQAVGLGRRKMDVGSAC